MCQHVFQSPSPVLQASRPASAFDISLAPVQASAPRTGSRRRRLWELSDHAHCPVIGVCMSIPASRSLLERLDVRPAIHDDYELHCLVVSESKHRTPLAESVQKDLDTRFKQTIRQASLCKTTEALQDWWRAAVQGPQLAAAFWVTLTHPRCTPELEHKVLGHVHMLQHQVGMACRVDQARFDALLNENAVLARHLAAVQDRHTQTHLSQCNRIEHLDGILMRTRAELLKKDTEIARLQEQLQTMISAAPDLPSRQILAKEKQTLIQQNQALRRQVHQARLDAASPPAPGDEPTSQPTATVATVSHLQPAPRHDKTPMGSADTRAVLCVGGRPSIVPIYRQLVERTGSRFLHHDGGEEHKPAQLDATLAAADLVICQTGCVSHNAYWRVKDYCKRTGKPCIFVDTPSHTAMKKALATITQDAPSS